MSDTKCLDSIVNSQYSNWLEYAKKLTKDNDRASELLHSVIESLYSNQKAISEACGNQFNSYVRRSLYLTNISPRSKLNYTPVHLVRMSGEWTADGEPENKPDLSDLIDSEILMSAINRLSRFERALITCYIHEDFNYEAAALASELNIDYLRHRVYKVLQKLRIYVGVVGS